MTIPEPLPRTFYEPSAREVAPDLLGHFLLRRVGEEWLGGPIVETEAYLMGDPACHAYKRETPRNHSMWGEPGHAYVYLIYGMHYCFNAVCRPAGSAEAVLVRAIEPLFGVDSMRERRLARTDRELTNGPAKFCAAMSIRTELDGADMCSASSPLIIAKNEQREQFMEERGRLVQTTRIGISQAMDWPLRWYLDGSGWVSNRGSGVAGRRTSTG